ncbi:glycosyltransferase [Massilia suwonensis]|uniref:Glycosyltransferase n=1 Tax=Massilia suwonensis TaxID=648895 RepID=A0ABW0MRG0_9BURK
MEAKAKPLHVVLVTIGSAGDLFPFLRIALALRAGGHQVSFLGPVQHEPFVREAGLPFHGLPADPAVLDHPDLWHPTRGFGVVWEATRPAMAAVPAFMAALPPDENCTMLVHPLALPEADLCRAARPGLRIAAVFLAPSNLPTVHDPLMLGPWRVPRWVPMGVRRRLWRTAGKRFIDPVALPDVNAARSAAGLAPMRTLVDDIVGIADLSIALFPDWFAPTQPDWPRPLVRSGFPLFDPQPDAVLSDALRHFLVQGGRPLVFTPGTGNRQARAYFAHAIEATRLLGERAVFLTPHRDQLPAELPHHVLWQDYVPLRALLPQVALLVHHGGIGTTAEALHAGTPQLVVPLAHDQFDNGARVEALGVGLSLPATRLNTRRLVAGLEALLDDNGLGKRCRAVAANFDGDAGVGQVVTALEGLFR